MMGDMICIFSFLAVLAVQIHGYSDIRKCFFKYYYRDEPTCLDLNGAINCIRQIDWNWGDEDKEKAITESLSMLYQDLSSSWCPALKNQGTCLSSEIDKCFTNTQIYILLKERKISKLCSEVQKYHSCLTNLQSICDNNLLTSHLREVQDIMKSCDSGHFKSYMTNEQCYSEIDCCTEEFHRLRMQEQYDSACRQIPMVKQCYTGLQPSCPREYLDKVSAAVEVENKKCLEGMMPASVNTSRQIFQSSMDACVGQFNALFKKEMYSQACGMVVSVGRCLQRLKPACPGDVDLNTVISDTTIRCPPQYLKDVCNFRAVYECTRNIPFDMVRTGDATNGCTKESLLAAKECLVDLEPFCVSTSHLKVLHEDLRNIHQYCQFPR